MSSTSKWTAWWKQNWNQQLRPELRLLKRVGSTLFEKSSHETVCAFFCQTHLTELRWKLVWGFATQLWVRQVGMFCVYRYSLLWKAALFCDCPQRPNQLLIVNDMLVHDRSQNRLCLTLSTPRSPDKPGWPDWVKSWQENHLNRENKNVKRSKPIRTYAATYEVDTQLGFWMSYVHHKKSNCQFPCKFRSYSRDLRLYHPGGGMNAAGKRAIWSTLHHGHLKLWISETKWINGRRASRSIMATNRPMWCHVDE